MLNNIELSRYYNVNSIIHKTNSFIKLLMLIIVLIISIISDNVYVHLVELLIILIIIILSKIPIKLFIKSIYMIRLFLFSIFLLNFIFKINLVDNIVQLFRIIELMLFSSIIIMTTNKNELQSAIIKIIYPLKIFKIDIFKLSFIINYSIKFIPIILDTTNKILVSLSVRGVDYKTSRLQTKILILKAIFLPVCILSLKQADEIAEAMDTRLYKINYN